jgi:hypothetical protein
MIVVASSFMFSERKRIADLALKHRLRLVGGGSMSRSGSLSYAVNL